MTCSVMQSIDLLTACMRDSTYLEACPTHVHGFVATFKNSLASPMYAVLFIGYKGIGRDEEPYYMAG